MRHLHQGWAPVLPARQSQGHLPERGGGGELWEGAVPAPRAAGAQGHLQRLHRQGEESPVAPGLAAGNFDISPEEESPPVYDGKAAPAGKLKPAKLLLGAAEDALEGVEPAAPSPEGA